MSYRLTDRKDGRMSRIPKLTAIEVEAAVAAFYGIRETVMVPNVSWGLLEHEADMVIMKASRWADEVEIKVSASDIKADLRKNRGRGHRRSPLIRKLWFAVPEHLADDPNIPVFAGILKINEHGERVEVYRPAPINPSARKLTDKETYTLMRLGCMRIWSLKNAAISHINDKRYNATKAICAAQKGQQND